MISTRISFSETWAILFWAVIFRAIAAVFHVIPYFLEFQSLLFCILIIIRIFTSSAWTYLWIARHSIEKTFTVAHRASIPRTGAFDHRYVIYIVLLKLLVHLSVIYFIFIRFCLFLMTIVYLIICIILVQILIILNFKMSIIINKKWKIIVR